MDTLQREPAAVNARRKTTRDLYRPLDIHRAQPEAWPATIPKLTEAEAKKAGRLLYQRFYIARWTKERGYKLRRRKLTVITTSGNRLNWLKPGQKIVVNPSGGWRRLVHELSHDFHARLRPDDNAHSDSHRHLEKEMIAHVVASGWLEGKLVPKPCEAKPQRDPLEVEHERLLARLKAWETRAKRAATAIAKLKKAEKALARRRYKSVRFSLS